MVGCIVRLSQWEGGGGGNFFVQMILPDLRPIRVEEGGGGGSAPFGFSLMPMDIRSKVFFVGMGGGGGRGMRFPQASPLQWHLQTESSGIGVKGTV
jgi:hypothetical protein